MSSLLARRPKPSIVAERLILVFIIISILSACIEAQVVLNATSSIEWDGQCVPDCDANECSLDRPCSLPLNGSVRLGSANSGSCTVLFLAGNYSTGHYTIEADPSYNGTLLITSEAVAIQSLNLSILATAEMSLDVTLQDLILDDSSSINLNSTGSVLVNASSFFDSSTLVVQNVTGLTIIKSILRPATEPSITITGHLSSLYLRETVAGSEISLISAEGTSPFSIVLCETNFVGPTLVTGSQPLTSVNITASLIVGVKPYLFSRNMDASLLYMCGADVQGAITNATLFPSQSRPFTTCIIDDLAPTNFVLGNISAQNLVLANSTLWGPQGTLFIGASSTATPVSDDDDSIYTSNSKGSPHSSSSSSAPSSLLIQNIQFMRILASAPSLSIIGDDSQKQTVQFWKNSWNFSGPDLPDLGDVEIKNVSSVIDFGTACQVIPSLLYDHITFTGKLSVSSKLIGLTHSLASPIIAANESSTLELYSIDLQRVDLTKFDGNFRYIASSPSVGLTGSYSKLNLTDSLEVSFTSATQLVVNHTYPISGNTTCDFECLNLVTSGWTIKVDCHASNRTLSFTPLSSGIKPHISPYNIPPPNSANRLIDSLGIVIVVLTTWLAL